MTELISQSATSVNENMIDSPHRETGRNQRSKSGKLVEPTNFFTPWSQSDIEQSISARFEAQVDKYPDNIAVKTKNYQWTYTQLNQQANRVGQTIVKHYPEGDHRIALLFEQDAPIIAGILGVIKAGKTYVPLDPDYPRERVIYILEDSCATAVITNTKNWSLAQELTQGIIPLINIDEIQENISEEFPNIPREILPDTLAYILYTSGSTGQPKGVMQNHRNLLHFIRNYTNNLHINEQDRLTLMSSTTTDAAVVDIFSAILNGATLYPMNIKNEGLTHLSQFFGEQEISIYHSTPTVYRHFVSSLPEINQLHQLRLIVLGGEEVVKSDVDLFKAHFSKNSILVNGYGSTESTFNLQYLLDKDTEIDRRTVPIGYPFESTDILLLNEGGKLTDIYGEIAIRSPYIALGYWQKPELTQAVFIPDPSGGDRRIYRTGDMGRLREDGSIEFLGRKDFQVKIRGFRIELGEIEAALNQYPDIQESVVIAREDIPGDKRLVAYLVPQQGQKPTIEELCHFLKQKLPDYMVPSAFVFLDALPLTPNGKIDRRALPAPDISTDSFADKFVLPRDKLELQLTQIWQKVLGKKPIGIKDNFFELGGHSLLTLRLFDLIEKTFNRKLPLATLFQGPTVEQLANIMRQSGWTTSWFSLVPIQPRGSKPPLFGIHYLGKGSEYYRNIARYLGSDQPIYGVNYWLATQTRDKQQPPPTKVEELAADYIKEIRTLQPDGPYLLAGLSFGGIVAYEMAQQLQAQGEKVGLLVLFDTHSPVLKKSMERTSIQTHLRNLSQMGLQEKLAYIMPKIRYKIWKKTPRAIKSLLLKMTEKFYLELNLPIPDSLDNLIVVHASNKLAREYKIQVYPGQVTLFRASEQFAKTQHSRDLGWSDLAGGGVEIRDVPGDHLSMFQEPFVEVVTEKLKACIDRAIGQTSKMDNSEKRTQLP